MFCTRCGSQLGEGARYCTSCGQAVNGPGSSPAGDAPAQGALARKRLRRVIQGKKLAGVCAGFAEYFEVDVTLMRIIWVALTLLPPHVGFIGYLIAWAILPKS